jgi:hypothetical protein
VEDDDGRDRSRGSTVPMVPDDVAVDDEKAPGPLVDVDVAVEVPGPDAMAVFVLPSAIEFK